MVESGTQNPCDIQIEPCDHSLNILCSVSVVKLNYYLQTSHCLVVNRQVKSPFVDQRSDSQVQY